MSNLLNLLNCYDPLFPEEQDAKSRMLTFIKENEATCFNRSLDIGHITASAWLLDHRGERALLTHHAKLDMWMQLGGHCDGDPDVLAVALKEAREESGIDCIEPISLEIFDIDVHPIPETLKEKAHHHYDVRFLLRVMEPAEFQISEESKDLCWITKDPSTLPTMQRSVVRMFEKWCQYA